MYYLQSRYYDPAIGRFINADGYTSTGQGIIGNNMFAYCGNNPIARKDADGEAFETALDIASLAVSAIEFAANPTDLWALAAFSGDLVDTLIPFVTGVGETVKIARSALKATDAVDDAANAAKNINNTIKRVRSKAVKQAWENEVDLVRKTNFGSVKWNDLQKYELLTTGKVKGYEGHHMKSVNAYLDLSGRADNIQFLKRSDHLAAHRGNWRNPTHERYTR